MHADPFKRFLGNLTKKGHYKKVTVTPICGEFPTQPNLTKISIGLSVICLNQKKNWPKGGVAMVA